MEDFIVGTVTFLFCCLIVLGCIAIGAFVTMFAWNIVIADLLHFTPQINMVQAFAVNLLIGLASRVFAGPTKTTESK